MSDDLWNKCLAVLEAELPAKEYNSWIIKLEAVSSGNSLRLMASNRFILDWVKRKYLERISELLRDLAEDGFVELDLCLQGSPVKPSLAASAVPSSKQQRLAQMLSKSGAKVSVQTNPEPIVRPTEQALDDPNPLDTSSLSPAIASHNTSALSKVSKLASSRGKPKTQRDRVKQVDGGVRHESYINPDYTFDNFVPGPSNELAHSAAKQVISNPGTDYNPLYIYGPTGLGKTHLMHAIGNHMLKSNPNAHILYVHSERFFQDMLKAIQTKSTNEFKRYYRSVDLLMIDDVQFFGGKKGTMDEFFHTFNALLEGKQQIVLTSDRFAKDIEGLEERLKSRFNWGLSVCIEPPELELRVAILHKKALLCNIKLDDESALFIAQRIRSNVRELEGALKAVVAKANLKKRNQINVAFVQDALKDMLASHDKQISIDNIQRVVAEYYGLSINDLVSKRRTSNLVKPRHVAMTLAKELTNHSLPEIGRAFGGRDHSTVLHANRKVDELIRTNREYADSYKHLKRIIGG